MSDVIRLDIDVNEILLIKGSRVCYRFIIAVTLYYIIDILCIIMLQKKLKPYAVPLAHSIAFKFLPKQLLVYMSRVLYHCIRNGVPVERSTRSVIVFTDRITNNRKNRLVKLSHFISGLRFHLTYLTRRDLYSAKTNSRRR